MNLRERWIKENEEKLRVGGKYTKTTLFLLPILELCYKDFAFGAKNYLINCHIENLQNPKIICILSNRFDKPEEPFISLLQRLSYHYSFSESWYDNENEEIVFSFDVNKKFLKDYEYFLQGRYSLFSDDLKKRLVTAYGAVTGPKHLVNIWDAIYPSDKKRMAIAENLGINVELMPFGEVFDPPEIEIERYYTINDLKLKYGIE